MTNPLLAALVGAAIALVVSAVNDRFQRRRDRVQAAERRAERREQSEERRAERLNAERLALYVDLMSWAEVTAEREEAWTPSDWAGTDNECPVAEWPSTDLRARVDLLASTFVLEQFEGVMSSRWSVSETIAHLNRTDPDGRTTTVDDLIETTQNHTDALRRLRDACRSDMQGVLPDWHPDAENPGEDNA